MLLLGYDIGSSSIKAALVDGNTGKQLGLARYPETEMSMISEKEGWAEQRPEDWWNYLRQATQKLFDETNQSPADVKAIGISYQMHGLVALDKKGEVVRPSIIWCDSRAVEIGDRAFKEIGEEYCLNNLLNSPGNFTASKLRWVKENEPAIYKSIDKIMLPGDYIAYMLTGEQCTTASGLSEGIFWDFKKSGLSDRLLEYYDFDESVIPEIKSTFSIQGRVKAEVCDLLGFSPDTIVSYRGGDQPNNAFSLNVIQPGEVAATAGTSGVVYGISDQLKYDQQCRVNSFAHVNHSPNNDRIGVLLCINGTGSAYSWLRNQLAPDTSYNDLGSQAEEVGIGADGLVYLPFGNGAERMLGNKVLGAQLHNLHFNVHTFDHMIRACLEGIAFSFVYGIGCMRETGLVPGVIKAGDDNMFQSAVFAKTISTLTGSKIELKHTSGAIGAALGAGYGAGLYNSLEEAFQEEKIVRSYEPDHRNINQYQEAYNNWLSVLHLAKSKHHE